MAPFLHVCVLCACFTLQVRVRARHRWASLASAGQAFEGRVCLRAIAATPADGRAAAAATTGVAGLFGVASVAGGDSFSCARCRRLSELGLGTVKMMDACKGHL